MTTFYFKYRNWTFDRSFFKEVHFEYCLQDHLPEKEMADIRSRFLLNQAQYLSHPTFLQSLDTQQKQTPVLGHLLPSTFCDRAQTHYQNKIYIQRPLIIISHGMEHSYTFKVKDIYKEHHKAPGLVNFIGETGYILHSDPQPSATYLTYPSQTARDLDLTPNLKTHYAFDSSIPNHTLFGDYGPHFTTINIYTHVLKSLSDKAFKSSERMCFLSEYTPNFDVLFVSRGQTDLSTLITHLFSTFGLIYREIRILCCRGKTLDRSPRIIFDKQIAIRRICLENRLPDKYFYELQTRLNLLKDLIDDSFLIEPPEGKNLDICAVLSAEIKFYMKRYLYMLDKNIIADLNRFFNLYSVIDALYKWYESMITIHYMCVKHDDFKKHNFELCQHLFECYIVFALFLSQGNSQAACQLIEDSIEVWLENRANPPEDCYYFMFESFMTTFYMDLDMHSLSHCVEKYEFF